MLRVTAFEKKTIILGNYKQEPFEEHQNPFKRRVSTFMA